MSTDHVEAIKRLKHRYFHSVDSKDAVELRGCFVAGAHLDYGPGGPSSADAMAAAYEIAPDADRNVANIDTHLGLHPEIDLVGEAEAKGSWVLQFRRIDRVANTEMVMIGSYDDRYALVDGEWKIASCIFRSTWARIAPLPDGTVFI